MKREVVTCALAAFAVAAVVSAQAPKPGMQSDPDKNMKGGGLPAGWMARLDSASAKIDAVKFEKVGTGLHVQSGPAGIYYMSSTASTAAVNISATFTQLEPAAHPEAYGLFIGGSDLQGAGQKYTYFLIRQDGKFLIKRRNGADTPNVMPWTENAAIKKADASGKMSNVLAIQADKTTAKFLVNGTEVASLPAAQVDVEGITGIRINHNLNVQVDGLRSGAGKPTAE